MELSRWGAKMTRSSGINSIMGDIALATSAQAGSAWLNLSPGNPARIPEVTQTWRRLEEQALRDNFDSASCQYGPSRGADTLVGAIVDYFAARYGWDIGPQNVVVAPGSQMLAFVATTVFTGPFSSGQRKLVFPCLPEFAGFHGLSLEDEGVTGVEPLVTLGPGRTFRYDLDPDGLWRQEAAGMLLISSPANPTGRAADPGELRILADFARSHDIPLVVDNAYGLPFPQVTAASAEPVMHPNVINLFTASKAGLPGERLGFAIGPEPAISAITAFLANAILHPPQLAQYALAAALRGGELDRLASDVIRPYYQHKRQFAEKVLHDCLPESVNWRLHTADGGLFCWLWIDEPWFDDLELYHALKRKQVFVVPGRHFFTETAKSDFRTRCVRLSLSADEAVIAEAIARLAETLGELP